jgi:hypothetical protein
MGIMKTFKNQPIKKGTIAILLSLVLGSSAAAMNMTETDEETAVATDVSMAPGQDETEMNFSWYTAETATPGVLEVTRADGPSQTVTAELKPASSGFSGNEAKITGLEPDQEYEYRIGDGEGRWDETNTFTTRGTERFNFLLMGDPQIGSSWFASKDRSNWADTLDKAISKYPETSFIQSVGDQVDDPESEKDYSGFFAPDVLKEIPVATTIGNHDNSAYYGFHFNVPNETELEGSADAGGDYSFTYGDVLFMNLNTNNGNTDEHVQFMEQAVEETGDQPIKWKIVVFHHSIYSVGGHAEEDEILQLREGLVPAIDALDIDAVLMGHDHSYARTHQMENFEPLEDQAAKGEAAVSPQGTVYLTVNSSSGSKFYDLADGSEPYAAVKQQVEVPTFTNVAITPHSLSFETFRTDTMKQVDGYKISKD